MVKAGKWIKSILIGGKKDKDKVQKDKQNSSNVITDNPTTPTATPKERKRWSFRRSSATAPNSNNSNESTPTKPVPPANVESPHIELKKPDLGPTKTIQEAASVKIQSVFRSYLARKALRALRGLVKLQALVRGRLVRKRATATLRCMEAILTAQARARAQRIRSVEEGKLYTDNNNHFMNSYHEVEKGMMEENIKIVEMDIGESKGSSKTRSGNNNYSYYQNNDRRDDRFYVLQDYQRISPAPSAITDISPRTCSGYFDDYAFTTAQSSPQCYYYSTLSKPDPFPRQEHTESMSYDYPLYPNYMANTQSSRAKARSQSAPKQRPDSFERQQSKRRPSVEGRNNIPRAVRMQRSSSHIGATAQNYHYPWSIKLDKSAVSHIESECGSTCSVLTATNYCRSEVPYDHQGNRY